MKARKAMWEVGGIFILTIHPVYVCIAAELFLRGKDDLALSHDVTLQYPG
jgi:hypothetical protein